MKTDKVSLGEKDPSKSVAKKDNSKNKEGKFFVKTTLMTFFTSRFAFRAANMIIFFLCNHSF
jgi:hypothetical protein